jgi:RNA polymerase sigma-70 factor (ECF subfamily)
LEQALTRLEQEYRDAANTALFDELKQMLAGESSRPSHAEAGRKLGMSEAAVRQASYRLRERSRLLLREEIAHTVAMPGDVEDELQHFIRVLQAQS